MVQKNLSFVVNFEVRAPKIAVIRKRVGITEQITAPLYQRDSIMKANVADSNRTFQVPSQVQKVETNNYYLPCVERLPFGHYGIFFCNSGTISKKFLETTRLSIAKRLKKVGRFWIRICADTPVTARSAETRMGRGKGSIEYYEARIRPGQTFLEFNGVPKATVDLIYRDLLKKTPIPIRQI